MNLYVSSTGREVRHSSSSALDSFRFCRRKFKLSRIDGWKQKAKKASLQFGKAVESAIQFHSDNGRKPGDAVEEFRRIWLKFSDDKELVYTEQENNHWDLLVMGTEMMRLWEILLPSLPIYNPKWQLQFQKKLWPGTEYDDLEFTAYIDLLSTADDGTRTIWDIKSAKSMLDVTPGMMAMDGQLRKYAWVSNINRVGFLNFVKAGHPNEFRKGTTVSLLEDVGEWKAGQVLEVAKFTAPKPAVPASEGVKASPEVFWSMLVGTKESVQQMDEESDKISGKGSKERTEQLLADYVSSGRLVPVSREQVTKIRIQAVQGVVPEDELAEIGQQIGADTFAIYQASQNNSFFADGGVRFPNNSCSWCEMRGICTRNDSLRDELLIQIKPAAKKEEIDDWLTELETEDAE